MHTVKAVCAAAVVLGLAAGQAEAAAPICTSSDELAALRTAAVQQQLMVAALTCQATEDYNRFVLAYRPELQKSDADLKVYFVRRNGTHGEADYDSFKTRLANLSALSNSTNAQAYCANARAAFDMAMRDHRPLASFVADQRLMIALPDQKLCSAEPETRMAAVKPEPVPAKSAEPKAPARPAPLRVAEANLAPASPPASEPHATPPSVPREQSAPPAEIDLKLRPAMSGRAKRMGIIIRVRTISPPPLPPPRPVYYGYAGWPPGWAPPPYPRWYPPASYYFYYGR